MEWEERGLFCGVFSMYSLQKGKELRMVMELLQWSRLVMEMLRYSPALERCPHDRPKFT